MPAPRNRSKTLKRVYKSTPQNRGKLTFRKGKPSAAICGISKKKLNGMPKLRQGPINKLSKSKKRPNRIYGGTYSHSVVQLALKNSVWNE